MPSDNSSLRRWGGVLFGLGALLAVVFLACVALSLHDRRAKGRAAAGKDTEKGVVAVSVRSGQPDLLKHHALPID